MERAITLGLRKPQGLWTGRFEKLQLTKRLTIQVTNQSQCQLLIPENVDSSQPWLLHLYQKQTEGEDVPNTTLRDPWIISTSPLCQVVVQGDETVNRQVSQWYRCDLGKIMSQSNQLGHSATKWKATSCCGAWTNLDEITLHGQALWQVRVYQLWHNTCQ